MRLDFIARDEHGRPPKVQTFRVVDDSPTNEQRPSLPAISAAPVPWIAGFAQAAGLK